MNENQWNRLGVALFVLGVMLFATLCGVIYLIAQLP